MKELIFSKFDLILAQISSLKDVLIDRFSNITSRIDRLDQKTDALLENDTPLLQAAIHLTQSLQSVRQDSLQSFTTINQSLQQLEEVVAEKIDTVQLESQQHHQSLTKTFNHLNAEGQQRHQLLMDSFQQAFSSIEGLSQDLAQSLQQQGEAVAEKIDTVQIESQQRHQSLTEAVEHINAEGQQRHQSIIETFEHLKAENQQRHRLLVDSLHQAFSSIEVLSQNLAKVLKAQSNQKIIINSDEKTDVEASLMAHLYSYLPSPIAIDVGANRGDISEVLLKTGYEVYAFEPFPPIFSKLSNRLAEYSNFRASNFALGSADESGTLHIATDKTDTNLYGDSSLYSSLIEHSMPEDLIFTDKIPVTVRALESLHNSLELPSNIGIIKIDTEGLDLEVIRGMGSYRYPVVITEFWNEEIPFGKSKTFNKLEDTVKEMRQRKYLWYIVIYRIWGSDNISFYCNYPHSLKESWGNIFFFQDQNIFTQALNWCSVMLPMTYIKNA